MNELTPIGAIRALSGIFSDDKQKMQDRLALICLLARYIQGDVDESFVDEMMEKVGIKLIEVELP